MNENENTSVEIQEVAEPVNESVETVEVAEQPEVSEVEEVVEVKPKFTEKDTAYANMRRESERLKSENERYKEALQRFGFNGSNSDDIIDQANAHYYGKSVEEIRNNRIAKEQEKQKHDELMEKVNYYETKEIEERMQSDLAKIQKINPQIKSLGELGEPYFDLIRRGIDGERAYKLLELDGLIAQKNIRAEQEAIKKVKANAMSSVGALDSQPSKPKGIDDLSDAEFEALRQRALRGELRRT